MTEYKKVLSLFAASLLLFSCTTEKTWDFNTDYFSIGVNDKGYITSMKIRQYHRPASSAQLTNPLR